MNVACGNAVPPVGSIAVLFISRRNGADEAGYAAAAEAMEAMVREQPGYLGHVGVRQGDGLGITISYWEDERSARNWRAVAEHASIRALGRARWYAAYRLVVTQVLRGYDWNGPPDQEPRDG